MAKVGNIFGFVDSFAPFASAMDFDNVGILVGDATAEVKKCLVALDVTEVVINEAENVGATLIISHHPVIFSALKTLPKTSIPHMLAQRDISVICAHTNFDMASFGVNTCLAEALSLKNLEALSHYESKIGTLPMGLAGELEKEFSCAEFAKFVKDRLNCEGVRYTDVSREIKTVAICSGSGGDLIETVARKNIDAFVTGEIKHHEILTAARNEICVVEAGHFKSEDVVILPLVNKLADKFKDVEFVKSVSCTDGIKYLA